MELEHLEIDKRKIKQLNSKGIHDIEGLLKFIPKKYYDYANPKLIKSIVNLEENISVVGRLSKINLNSYKKYIIATLTDSLGYRMTVCWFGTPYIYNLLEENKEYIFCGKVTFNEKSRLLQFSNPLFSDDIDNLKILYPVYSKIKGMSDEFLRNIMEKALSLHNNDDYLEESIQKKYGLIPQKEMYRLIHNPKHLNEIKIANRRILFDDLFELVFAMKRDSFEVTSKSNITCKNMNSIKRLLDSLPFKLTDGPNSQLETVRNILKEINSNKQTFSLIQGDVSCGKTFVAILLMLAMAENSYQSVLMAPTTILANQHYEEITERLKNFEFVNTILLTNGLTAREKKSTLKKIASGEANIIIGTHSIISEVVRFNNLGLAVIDEEHRFGVNQRRKILDKAKAGLHTVIMSATPIPRTLGLSIYGEGSKIYNIEQMPSGRKKIITDICTDINKGYNFIYNEVKKGHQAYIVCPLIEESESERMEDVESVNETYNEMQKFYKGKVKIGIVNGKMKKSEVDTVIEKFSNKEIDVLLSTTIIEVGVNIPNATVIMIKNAERFGLAQLHQLRGRVGRSNIQSYCILATQKEDVERLKIMKENSSGFKIAQKDLKLRGMGDFIGTKQSGNYRNVMQMLLYPKLYEVIKNEIEDIFKEPMRYNRYNLYFDNIVSEELIS